MSATAPVLQLIASLPKTIHGNLFAHVPTVLSLFRLLSPVAQQIILRLLFLSPGTVLNCGEWLNDWQRNAKPTKLYAEAIEQLRSLSILSSLDSEQSSMEVSLDEIFQEGLLMALQPLKGSKAAAESFGSRCSSEDKYDVNEIFLEQYATDRWDSILHFMVGSREKEKENVLQLLYSSGLMAKENESLSEIQGNLRITNKGFQFLLQEQNAQIWALLLKYAELSEHFGIGIADVLNFFFFIGNLSTNKDYSTKSLDVKQLKVLGDLADFGLIYLRKRTADRFYPTRLASIFSATCQETASLRPSDAVVPGTPSSKPQDQKAFIVVETNYRLYAYTNSPLQIAILSLFLQLRCRFPNLVVGIINRDSVRQALFNGITANQIVQYLTAHAHPQMKGRIPIIPPTIVDQINLWELELNRLKSIECFLYKDFTNEYEFNKVLEYAKSIQAASWWSTNPRKLVMAVTDEGHQLVKTFVKNMIAEKRAL